MSESTLKHPMPGYGIAIIDSNEDDGDDKWEGPQIGKLILLDNEDKDRKSKKSRDNSNHTFGDLVGKKVYWLKYADADGKFFDKELGEDILFLELDKIIGYDT